MERNKNRVKFQIKPSDLANTVITKSNPNKNYSYLNFWSNPSSQFFLYYSFIGQIQITIMVTQISGLPIPTVKNHLTLRIRIINISMKMT